MPEKWVVKRRHYDGGISVIAIRDTREGADWMAAFKNSMEQTDAYYVEKWREA